MSAVTSPMNVKVWRWVGVAAGLLLLAWVLRDFDLSRFRRAVAAAQIWPLFLLPVATVAEQLLRALKWRQMLHPLRPVRVWRLFGAIMAGYLANLAAPVRVSPFVRAWLIARLEGLSASTVLATVALDRLIDGLVFVGFTALAIAVARFPDTTGIIREGLAWGAAFNLALFSGLIAGLIALRRFLRRESGARALITLTRRLPRRWREPVSHVLRLFADGVVWPADMWRGILIFATAIAIKIVAVSYFLWAGLAFGVALTPGDYLFLMVFLGFLVILAGTLRLVGGFMAGAVFVLQGLGVELEVALAMALLVQTASLLTVAATGAAALWVQGFSLNTIFQAGKNVSAPAPETGEDGSSEV